MANLNERFSGTIVTGLADKMLGQRNKERKRRKKGREGGKQGEEEGGKEVERNTYLKQITKILGLPSGLD